MPLTHTPYWRLSGFYFSYFASLGILVPYWGLYLQGQGFNAQDIGELTAILLATRLVAPNIWAWIADHYGHRMRIIRLASFISLIAFSAILIDSSYVWIASIMLLFSFFWNASLPQFEVTTLQHLGDNSHYYGKIRLWGSIGFIISVTLLGALLEHYTINIVPYAIIISMLAIWLVSLSVPDLNTSTANTSHQSFWSIIKRRDVIAFLAVCFLVQVSHGPYYTFYSIYLEQHDYSRNTIGLLWALGVVAEVIVFIFIYRYLPKFGLRKLILYSLLLSTIRWLLIGLFPDNITILIVAQILHAFSFGTFHLAAIAWVHQHFIAKNQGRGQALYSSVGFGAGGAVGSLASGYLWLSPGPTITFSLAALSSLLAFFIGLRWLK